MKINVEKVEKQLKATLAVENKKPSKQGENITNLYLKGKINSETAIEQIIKHYKGGNYSDNKVL
jgi:hypothetical protein